MHRPRAAAISSWPHKKPPGRGVILILPTLGSVYAGKRTKMAIELRVRAANGLSGPVTPADCQIQKNKAMGA